MFYGSSETHLWAVKAAELLGLGRRSFRRVEVDDRYRIDIDALRLAIARDRRDGLSPFCVMGTAGTVNTGTVDDLVALAALSQAEDLWFHVDGAFGALARLSPETRGLVAGLDRADSLAFDLHKWMYLPYAVACVLVRDGEALPSTFASDARYLDHGDRGVIAGGLPFADRGIDLTRDFKALKSGCRSKRMAPRRAPRSAPRIRCRSALRYRVARPVRPAGGDRQPSQSHRGF